MKFLRKKLLFLGLLLIIIGVFSMAVKDLSPKLKLKNSDIELELPENQLPMGQNAGGLQLYSNKFKRGYGDQVFGSDSNGIWLGGAEFEDAPYTVDMDGAATMKSATFIDENDTTVIDASGLISTASFEEDFVGAGSSQSISSSSWTDITGATVTSSNFARNKRVFAMGTVSMSPAPQSSTYFEGTIRFALTIDGVQVSEARWGCQKISGGQELQTLSFGLSVFEVSTLGTGTHTFKLQAKVDQVGIGNARVFIIGYDLGFFVLGN